MSKNPRRSPQPSGTSYHPNEKLAQAIVRAWSDEDFRDQLLTFQNQKKPDWSKFSPPKRKEMIARTSKALEEVDVFLDAPVVLTVDQYKAGYTPDKAAAKNEVVFVLPDVIGKKDIGNARIAMGFQIFGM